MIASFIIQVIEHLEFALRYFLATKVSPAKQSQQPMVSIVIVVYNGLPYLKQCLSSLGKTNYHNYEIILVDNGSDLDTKKYCQSIAKSNPRVKLIRSKTNEYFSGGNNLGVQMSHSKTKYVLLLNSDVIINRPDWLTTLVALAPTDKGIISYGYAAIPFRPDGYSLLISKSLYIALGGIKRKYKMNWGITDLTRRALETGSDIAAIINPEKYLTHLGGKSYTVTTRQKQDISKPGVIGRIFSTKWYRVKALKIR